MAEIRSVAWWVFWRAAITGLILGVISGAIIGFFIGFIFGALGAFTPMVAQAISVLGFVAGIISSFLAFNYFLARAVEKGIGGLSISIIDKNP